MRTLLTAGVVISGSAAAWLRIERLLPPRLAPALRATIESSTLGLPPNAPETAEQVQTAGLNALLGIVAVLTVLGAMVALLSFIALALARATERRTELATRAALGATPGTLFGELLREPARAGVWALLIGAPLALAIVFIARSLWPGLAGFDVRDVWTILLLTMTPALLAPLAAACVSYFAVVRQQLAGALAVGSRATSSPGEVAFRNMLPVCQIAASLGLLVAAATLMLNAMPLTAEDARDVSEVSVAKVNTAALSRDAAEQLAALLEEVNSGGAQISFGSIGAWVGPGESDRITAECDHCVYGSMTVPFNVPQMIRHAVAPKYFDTVGIQLIAGRDFTLADGPSADPVVIVSEAFAARNFGRNPVIGRKVEIGAMSQRKVYRIIGVVEDVHTRTIGQPEILGTLYFPVLQHTPDRIEIVSRGTEGDVIALARRVGLDAEAPESATTLLGRLLAPVRFLGWAMLLISVGGVLFALHGVHAMLRASVARRVPEIGIRIALGADPRSVLRLILNHALTIVAAGTTIGAFIAFGAARGVQALMPSAVLEPLTIVLGVALLGIAAVAGALPPARRAARVDPLACWRE